MRIVVLSLALLLGLPTLARAGDEVATAQGVIRAQDQALGRDDAAEAFSYAAPGVVNIFHTPDIFMSMVRKAYAPVYRHKSFEFGAATAEDGKVRQTVHIIDADGDAWEALYTLEPQPDGSLKISSCVLRKEVDA
jgi:hypothetical protein